MIKKSFCRIIMLIIILLFVWNKDIYGYNSVNVYKEVLKYEWPYFPVKEENPQEKFQDAIVKDLIAIFNYDQRDIYERMTMKCPVYIVEESENYCNIRVRRSWSKRTREV